MMEVATLEEERAKRPGTIQTVTTTRPESVWLDLATARHLLQEHGYDLVERFGHVHATRDAREWHLCLIADLASMSPSRLLTCLDDALKLHIEQSVALSPHV